MSIVNALNAARMKFDPAALRPRPLGQPAALAPAGAAVAAHAGAVVVQFQAQLMPRVSAPTFRTA